MSYRAYAINTVITALLVITAIIIFIIFVSGHIGLQLEKRRGAAKDTPRCLRWVPLLRRREKPSGQDIEMHGWPLKYPDPAMVISNRQHPDDSPLLRSEPAVISERRQNRFENSKVGSGSPAGSLEGFPYFVR